MKMKELYEKHKGCKAKTSGAIGIICGYSDETESLIMCVDSTSGGWSLNYGSSDCVIVDEVADGAQFLYVGIEDIISEPQKVKPKKSAKIRIVSGGQVPVMGSEGAAGYDVFAREIIKVNANYYKVKLGIRSEIADEYYAELTARSSVTDTGWGLANSIGIIDSDFRGEWQARFRPFKDDKDTVFPFNVGDRVAQFIIKRKEDVGLEIVDELSDSNRGSGGFGSTGKK